MIALNRSVHHRGLMLFALLVSACGDGGSSGPPVASSIALSGALPGTAPVGSALTPAVRVTTSSGSPVEGATVTFEVTAGGGTVSAASAPTNSNGVAAAGTWTLGTASGANTLMARTGSLNVAMVVNATALPAAAMAPATGNPAQGTAGLALPVPAGVLITDTHGNPVPGVSVTFTAAAGSGIVFNGVQPSGADGIARPGGWTLGQVAGMQTLNAVAGSFSTSVSIQAVAGPASALVPLSPTSQAGQINEPVAIPPMVRAQDQFGNFVQGITVTFAAAGGGGSVVGGTQVTNEFGIASVGSWTLGSVPGSNSLTANITGGGFVSFTATAVGPGGVVGEKLFGDNTTCPVSATGCVFSVRVVQGSGQPVAGETVTWSNGTNTLNTITNGNGVATASNLPPNNTPGLRTQTAEIQTSGQQLVFDYELVTGGQYNIEIRYAGSTPSAEVQAAINQARLRWEQVITGDVPNVVNFSMPASSCHVGHPAITNENIDDLLIFIEVESIDGSGNTLASAGPCRVRTEGSRLPAVGSIRIDADDIPSLVANGRLRDVIIHEMGHVLGIPHKWNDSLNPLLQDSETNNPYYIGQGGVTRFVAAGGTLIHGLGVPVEGCGPGAPAGCGAGTRNSHWRESVLATEAMTGYLGATNPLSAITIGSLFDFGYQVNFGAADPYTVPGAGVQGLDAMRMVLDLIELKEIPMPPPLIIP